MSGSGSRHPREVVVGRQDCRLGGQVAQVEVICKTEVPRSGPRTQGFCFVIQIKEGAGEKANSCSVPSTYMVTHSQAQPRRS